MTVRDMLVSAGVWLDFRLRKLVLTPSLDDVGPIPALLVDDNQRPIGDPAAWRRRRDQLKAEWLSFLGPMPDPPIDTALTILRDDSLPDCTRRLVRYECEPGQSVEAWLIQSTDSKFTG